MTIRIYPSRLPGEPLETHQHKETTLNDWLTENVEGYESGEQQPIAAEVNGVLIKAVQWQDTAILSNDEVRLYPVPQGAVALAWIAVAVAVASAAYAIFAMQGLDASNQSIGSGSALDLNPAKANSASLGDPIREVFGKYRIYPDYVVPPVGRFDKNDPEKYINSMFVCLGVGKFALTEGDIRVGATPVASLGDDFNYKLYAPGEDVRGDERTEVWYNSTEVGGTTSCSGLDMGTTAPQTDDILAGSVTVARGSATFNDLETEATGGKNSNEHKLPDSWVVGSTITFTVPDTYNVSKSGLYSVISGNSLAEIAPYIGMPVSLVYNSITHSLFVASYTPAEADIEASITLAYDSAAGTAFSGIAEGAQRLSISHLNSEYRLLLVDGATVGLARLVNGVKDDTWPGFNARTSSDFQASGINDNESWLGPFLACPENETTDCFEVNFAFTSGICGFNDQGKKKYLQVILELQYRVYGSGQGWTTKVFRYGNKSINGLGYTERIMATSRGLIEVRCRRANEQGKDNARDSAFWQALRSRLGSRPSRYAGVTTMAVDVVTGGKLAAQSDRRINMVATRQYDRGVARTISGALYHVLDGLGIAADEEAINELEKTYWTPRQEFFDFSADSEGASALDILQKITYAGMGYFLLSDGLASAGREGIKPWTGAITPQETSEELKTTFTLPSQDDYDGVNVTYINSDTWSEETVHCRHPGNPTPLKNESFTLDGVINRHTAYRIGMRRLMGYRYQKLLHSTSTEMDALCYQYMDRIILTDDIPGHETLSCLIVSARLNGNSLILSLSESPDWSFKNPRCLIRLQDGSATGILVPTQVDEFSLAITNSPSLMFDEWVMDDPAVEPPRLIFCSSERMGYDALITEIVPASDGTCELSARQYSPLKYQYDDATYPGDVS